MEYAKISKGHWNDSYKIILRIVKESFRLINIDGIVRVIELLILLLKVNKLFEGDNIKKERHSICIIYHIPLACF